MRLIDADKLKEDFGEQRLDHDFCICGDESTARDLIDDAETVDAELVKHGKWLDEHAGFLFECSCCHAQFNLLQFSKDSKYCSNCGAKME